jgi:hypothetical protein
MCKLLAWGFPIALLLGMGAAAALGQDTQETASPSPKPFIRWSPYAAKMFGIDQAPKPAKKASAKPKKEVAKKPDTPARPASTKEDNASPRAREEAALLRRLEACDKLTEIAMRNNDTALLHRAEELNQRVWANYSQKTGQTPEDRARFESDQAAIDRLLGSNMGANAVQTPDSSSTRIPDQSSRAALGR